MHVVACWIRQHPQPSTRTIGKKDLVAQVLYWSTRRASNDHTQPAGKATHTPSLRICLKWNCCAWPATISKQPQTHSRTQSSPDLQASTMPSIIREHLPGARFGFQRHTARPTDNANSWSVRLFSKNVTIKASSRRIWSTSPNDIKWRTKKFMTKDRKKKRKKEQEWMGWRSWGRWRKQKLKKSRKSDFLTFFVFWLLPSKQQMTNRL